MQGFVNSLIDYYLLQLKFPAYLHTLDKYLFIVKVSMFARQYIFKMLNSKDIFSSIRGNNNCLSKTNKITAPKRFDCFKSRLCNSNEY